MTKYDGVRVVQLCRPDRPFDGTESVMRGPRVGDVGTICHEYDSSDPNAPVVVEMVDADGYTVWLADFSRDELELVERYSGHS